MNGQFELGHGGQYACMGWIVQVPQDLVRARTHATDMPGAKLSDDEIAAKAMAAAEEAITQCKVRG